MARPSRPSPLRPGEAASWDVRSSTCVPSSGLCMSCSPTAGCLLWVSAWKSCSHHSEESRLQGYLPGYTGRRRPSAPPVPSPHVSSLRTCWQFSRSFVCLLTDWLLSDWTGPRRGSPQTLIQSRFITRPHCVPRPGSHHSGLICAYQMGEKEESLPASARN